MVEQPQGYCIICGRGVFSDRRPDWYACQCVDPLEPEKSPVTYAPVLSGTIPGNAPTPAHAGALDEAWRRQDKDVEPDPWFAVAGKNRGDARKDDAPNMGTGSLDEAWGQYIDEAEVEPYYDPYDSYN